MRSALRVLFVLTLLVTTVTGCVTAGDKFPETKAKARRLARSERQALWSLPTDARAADIIEFLDEDRVLLGEVEGGGLYSSPSYGPVRLLDAGTGRVLWSASRESAPETTHILLATAPGLVFASLGQDEGVIWALDVASGRRLWEREVAGEAEVRLSPDRARLICFSRKGDAGRLEAIDNQRGTRLWDRDVEGGGRDLVVTDAVILVSGAAVRAFDTGSGRPLWEAALPELGEDPRSALAASRGVVAWTARGVALVDNKDGSTRWVRPVGKGGVKRVTQAGDALYRLVGSPDILGTDTLEALNTADGKVRWRRDTGGLVVSPLTVHRGLIAFTVEDALVGVKADDGSEAFRKAFDNAYAKANPVSARFGGVPDVFALRGDLLVIDREGTGLRAYRLPSGERVWKTKGLFGRGTVDGRYRAVLGGMKVNVSSPPPSIKMVDWPEPRPSPIAQRAQRNHDELMQRTARVLADSRSSAGDRRTAIEARKVSTGLEIARMETQVAMERTMAAAEAGLAAANAIATIGQALQKAMEQSLWTGLLTRARMGLRGAIKARETAFRGDVHLSGFADGRGRGVRLVDLKDGRLDALRYEPPDPLHRLCMVSTEAYGLSPSGKRLVVVGLGLDADRYESASSWGIKGTKASVLCFDPTKPKPKAPSPESRAVASAGKGSPTDMMMAITRDDLEAVRAMLDGGADPNQKIVLGQPPHAVATTPLRLAATGQAHPGIARLLIERGAKPTLEEIPGPTAMDLASEEGDATFSQHVQQRGEVRAILRAAGAKGRIAKGTAESRDPVARAAARLRGAERHLFLMRRALSDPELGDTWKRTAIVREVLKTGNRKLARSLIARGADVNAGDSAYGHTALHFGIMRLDPGLVRELLALGADPKVANKQGWTPLTQLFGPYSLPYIDPYRERMKQIVELLLKHGADPNTAMPALPAVKAKTLLEAAEAKSGDLADLLKAHGARR
jgi:outer membrane protein assembly factor BamB/ankyrin repeat protein